MGGGLVNVGVTALMLNDMCIIMSMFMNLEERIVFNMCTKHNDVCYSPTMKENVIQIGHKYM